ncbi:MAG: hypothetical protein LWX83_15055, partial [Anaerolineae bacterium]|nr:hypothetical protein [Anaerolineae bacterium]
MKKQAYSKLLDDVAKDQIPASLNLAPQILKRIQKNKGNMMNSRMKIVLPGLILVIALVIGAVN